MLKPPKIPDAPPPPPVFGEIQGKRPQRKSQTASFLGSTATPTSGSLGQSTLLGQ